MSLVTMRNCGMFHGTIAATTPTGSLRTYTSLPKKPGLVSCQGWRSARSQNARIMKAGRPTWARRAKLIGAPISAVMVSAISARRRS